MTSLLLPCRSTMLPIVLSGVGFLVQSALAQKPDFNAVPTFEKHVALIQKGISLHDEGDYDGAIEAYRRVLDENPDDISALYELAFTYFKKKDYTNCIRTAKSGTEYFSELLAHFYVVWGSCLDESGKPNKAVKIYRSALRQSPTDHLLHYNLAVTYKNLGKSKEAVRHFKKAIDNNPNHAGSHLGLAEQYVAQDHRIPALLAFARFLTLEPDSPRSGVALQSLHQVLAGQTSQDGGNNITIFLNPDANNDEGDFLAAEIILSATVAAEHLPESKDQTPLMNTLDRFGSLFTFFGKIDAEKEQRGFAWDHYVPYFAELEELGFTEPFVYHTHQIVAWDGIGEWIDANGEQMENFLSWSRAYREWPVAAATEQ